MNSVVIAVFAQNLPQIMGGSSGFFTMGFVLMLLGLVGGGLAYGPIRFPRVSALVRLVSSSFGVVFILFGTVVWFVELASKNDPPPPVPQPVFAQQCSTPVLVCPLAVTLAVGSTCTCYDQLGRPVASGIATH